MSVEWRPPYIPLLYSKIGVYRGIHYFLIFDLKHRLWVHVRTASRVHTIYALSKNLKYITVFHLKFIIFTAMKHSSILHRRVCVIHVHIAIFVLARHQRAASIFFAAFLTADLTAGFFAHFISRLKLSFYFIL